MKSQHKFVQSLAIAVALAAALPAFTASAGTEVTTTTTKKTYVFYGDKDIYYSPERKVYFYRESNGGDWKSAEVLPTEYQAFVKDNNGITIELATEKPYEQNEYVIKTYGHRHDRD